MTKAKKMFSFLSLVIFSALLFGNSAQSVVVNVPVNNLQVNKIQVDLPKIPLLEVKVKELAGLKLLSKSAGGIYIYDFGENAKEMTKTFVIKNVGTADLLSEGIGFARESYDDQFIMGNNFSCMGMLKIGQSCEMIIKFVPKVDRYGILVQATTEIIGVGVRYPGFKILATSTQTPNLVAGTLRLGTSLLLASSFKELPKENGIPVLDLGTTFQSITKEIIIKNTGTGDFTSEANGYAIGTDDQFSFPAPGPLCIGRFAPSKTCSILIKFTPKKEKFGAASRGEIFIETNDPRIAGQTHKFKVIIKATGRALPTLIPVNTTADNGGVVQENEVPGKTPEEVTTDVCVGDCTVTRDGDKTTVSTSDTTTSETGEQVKDAMNNFLVKLFGLFTRIVDVVMGWFK